jgi:GGDEF domain-containing protein
VQNIAKRIAEWRRGGSTLTVILVRLDSPVRADSADDENTRSPVRMMLQAARSCIREMDFVTRWQDDGVALLLPSTSAADAKTVARRLRAALLNESTPGNPGQPRLSASMGIAEGIEGNDAKRVLERAWIALEAARSAGPASVYVHDGLKVVAMKIVAHART